MKKTKIFKFLSIFLTKEVFRKYIKLICKMKLQVNELQKEAVAGGYSVKKNIPKKFTKFTGNVK